MTASGPKSSVVNLLSMLLLCGAAGGVLADRNVVEIFPAYTVVPSGVHEVLHIGEALLEGNLHVEKGASLCLILDDGKQVSSTSSLYSPPAVLYWTP